MRNVTLGSDSADEHPDFEHDIWHTTNIACGLGIDPSAYEYEVS